MPKVIVYVPAAAWRKLSEKGDPAIIVREAAKRGWELSDEPLQSSAGLVSPQGREAAKKTWTGNTELIDHFPQSAPRGTRCQMSVPAGTKCKVCGKVHPL